MNVFTRFCANPSIRWLVKTLTFIIKQDSSSETKNVFIILSTKLSCWDISGNAILVGVSSQCFILWSVIDDKTENCIHIFDVNSDLCTYLDKIVSAKMREFKFSAVIVPPSLSLVHPALSGYVTSCFDSNHSLRTISCCAFCESFAIVTSSPMKERQLTLVTSLILHYNVYLGHPKCSLL